MFGRKKKDEFYMEVFFDDHGLVKTDGHGYNILKSIRSHMEALELENEGLKAELEAIKPVIENPDYKPPKSRDCCDCKFAVYNPWDNISVIGCRKDSLCEDFKPKEK